MTTARTMTSRMTATTERTTTMMAAMATALVAAFLLAVAKVRYVAVLCHALVAWRLHTKGIIQICLGVEGATLAIGLQLRLDKRLF